MMKLKSLGLVAAFLLVGAGVAGAQQVPQEEPLTRPRTGVGVQLTWPTYGLSGVMDLTDNLTVQGVVGPFWGLSLTGRGIYRLTPLELFTPFAYGAVGYSTGFVLGTVSRGTVHFGGGGGVDVDVRNFVPDLPPIFVNLEAGLMFVPWPGGGGTSTYFMLGPGVHYRF